MQSPVSSQMPIDPFGNTPTKKTSVKGTQIYKVVKKKRFNYLKFTIMIY